MNKLTFLIGASGAGKTTAAKDLEKKRSDIKFCYFDSIGVPSTEEMVRDFGSPENWQKEKTIEWVKNIKEKYLEASNVVLDAQTRPEFIKAACEKYQIENYNTLLFDCSDEVRKERLLARGNPELINENMMNWARFLREETKSHGYEAIDTSHVDREQMSEVLLGCLRSGENNEPYAELELK